MILTFEESLVMLLIFISAASTLACIGALVSDYLVPYFLKQKGEE